MEGDKWVSLLKKEDVKRVLNLLLNSLNLDTLERHSLLINKLLTNTEIEEKDFEEIENKYTEVFKEFEENYLKAIGYLEFEKDKLV